MYDNKKNISPDFQISNLKPSFTIVWSHSHKKRKDRLEGNLDRVVFPTELEFSKILVARLPNVNTKCAGKSEWSKQLCSLYLTAYWSTDKS